MTTETSALNAVAARIDAMSQWEVYAILPELAALHARAEAVTLRLAAMHARAVAIARGAERRTVVAPLDDMLTVAAAAEVLGVSRGFVYEHQKQIPGSAKIGGSVRFSRSGLKEFMAGARNGDDDHRRPSVTMRGVRKVAHKGL
jgi:excisionase family DNA binding protein